MKNGEATRTVGLEAVLASVVQAARTDELMGYPLSRSSALHAALVDASQALYWREYLPSDPDSADTVGVAISSYQTALETIDWLKDERNAVRAALAETHARTGHCPLCEAGPPPHHNEGCVLT